MSEDKKDISYRGGKLSEEDQAKIAAEEATHEDDVTDVEYRGAKDSVQLHKKHEPKSEHIQYRGAEDDVDL